MYVIMRPYSVTRINVCWVCYNIYESSSRVIRPGLSTSEDIIMLKIALKIK